MNTVKASEAKTHFGEILIKAQSEPIEISRNGKPIAVILSSNDYSEIEDLKLQLLKKRIEAANKDIENNNLTDGDEFIDSLVME